MYAVHVHDFGIDALTVQQAPDPVPGPGEVLIATEAATVNRADLAVVTGAAAPAIPAGATRPYTPGWDVCGRVVGHGPGVDAPPIGSRVVGFSLWFAGARGTQSTLVALPAADVAVAPDGLSPARLTTVGLDGLTAWHAVGELRTGPGQSVVIVGAAGAVGGFALDLAVLRGASVIAVVAAADRDAALARGATDVVLRDDAERLAAIRADAVLDTASVAAALLPAVRDGGRFVTTTVTPPAERGITVVRSDAASDPAALAEMLAMATDGRLATPVAAEFPLTEARAAYRAFEAGTGAGRIVLTADPER
jgi:NADPH2:quinone reductase